MKHTFEVYTDDPIVEGMAKGNYEDVSQQFVVVAVLQHLFPGAVITSNVNQEPKKKV